MTKRTYHHNIVEGPDQSKTDKVKCGIVMPISGMAEYTESHWADVLDIIRDAIEEAGLEANLVSNADETTIIQKTIVHNLYDNPIVVCDISGKNPNVMFELGLRLAFDKPTIVVKDSVTSYSFDTGSIEHLQYPRDLRFSKIVDFKARLTAKITATLMAASSDSEYSTFLKHFGKFRVAQLEETEVTGQQFLIEELRAIRHDIATLRLYTRPPRISTKHIALDIRDIDSKTKQELRMVLEDLPGVRHTAIHEFDGKEQLLLDIEQQLYDASKKMAIEIRDTLRTKSTDRQQALSKSTS